MNKTNSLNQFCLLNDRALDNIRGGFNPGDVIYKTKILGQEVVFIMCYTYECSCSGEFTWENGKGNCTGGFTTIAK